MLAWGIAQLRMQIYDLQGPHQAGRSRVLVEDAAVLPLQHLRPEYGGQLAMFRDGGALGGGREAGGREFFWSN